MHLKDCPESLHTNRHQVGSSWDAEVRLVNTGQGTELGSRAGCVTNWHVPLSEGHQNSPTARHPSCVIPLPWGRLGKCFSVASLRFPGLQGSFPEL